MNRSMDDLLRSTFRNHAADPAAACVDAETAAAYIDGTLSARARSSAEAHLADCARCQAVLAALVRSTPAPTIRAWWRRASVAWLVPAAAAAGAVAIWINIPEPGNAPSLPKSNSAEVAPREPSAIEPPAQPQTSSVVPPPESVEAVGTREATKGRSGSSLADASVDKREDRKADAAAAAPAPQAAAAPPAAADRLEAARAELARTATPKVDPVTLSGAAPVVDSRSVAVFTTLSPLIVSSNQLSQWRVGTVGQVQHSADGGRTWQSQDLGVSATPVAGSSPSPSVCWLVGRDGLVLLTTNEGRSWDHVSFPVEADLVSVRAADDRTATIVAADGRAFLTTDAGRTWRQ